ncbi:hypothetical protein [Mucilaginibacter sp. SJ]|uniref:hypothetical protein n=1 Tax=Mucilaginibacter sp. SJ TaxID=3029053 RepID=UPI0023A9E47B|nr:hypothetical protein [Mucilaginibacter sp. SJ]WEA00712.1 hypothetical protein MusilaSJ_24980 [Mucilaginibacter sp. SJ]
MKIKTLILALVLLWSFKTYAQTIPLGFTNGNRYPIKLKSFSFTDTSGNISQKLDDGKTNFMAENYKNLAERLNKQASEREEEINEEYQKAFDELDGSKGVEVLEANRKLLDNKRELDLKEVNELRKAAEGYLYLVKTSGWIHAFFVTSSVDAEMFYNGTVADSKSKFLNNSLLSISSDGGKASIFNELYADYIGAVRVGFGALISNKSNSTNDANPDEKKEDAVQRLLGGGGNGVLNLSYPIIEAKRNNELYFKLIAAPKLAVDIPKLGTDNNKYAVNYNFGVEGAVFYTGALNILTFYSNFRFANVSGNGLFYDNLAKSDKKSFGFNQLSFGMAITSTFRVSYNYYFGSSYVKENFPSTFSFTIIPN